MVKKTGKHENSINKTKENDQKSTLIVLWIDDYDRFEKFYGLHKQHLTHTPLLHQLQQFSHPAMLKPELEVVPSGR